MCVAGTGVEKQGLPHGAHRLERPYFGDQAPIRGPLGEVRLLAPDDVAMREQSAVIDAVAPAFVLAEIEIRVAFERHFGIERVDVVIEFGVVARDRRGAEARPLLHERIDQLFHAYRTRNGVVRRGRHAVQAREAEARGELRIAVVRAQEGAEGALAVLAAARTRLAPHLHLVEMDEVQPQFLDSQPHHFLEELHITGIVAAGQVAESLLGVVIHGPAELVDLDPVAGAGFLGEERFVGHGSADVAADAHAMLVGESGQAPRGRDVLGFRLEPEPFVQTRDDEVHSERLQLHHGLLGVLNLPELTFFGGLPASPLAED